MSDKSRGILVGIQLISNNDSLYVDLHLGGSVSGCSQEYVDCDFFLDLFRSMGYCLSVLEYMLECRQDWNIERAARAVAIRTSQAVFHVEHSNLGQFTYRRIVLM